MVFREHDRYNCFVIVNIVERSYTVWLVGSFTRAYLRKEYAAVDAYSIPEKILTIFMDTFATPTVASDQVGQFVKKS